MDEAHLKEVEMWENWRKIYFTNTASIYKYALVFCSFKFV